MKEKKRQRLKEIAKRKNFLPALIICIFLWFFLGIIILFIDPFTYAAVPIFFINVFLTSLFTFSILLANTRRGAMVSLAIVGGLALRYFGVGSLLNIILLFATLLLFEIYFSKNR